MIERETRYLLSSLPDSLEGWLVEYVEDKYFPDTQNPQMRLRRQGDRYMLTKKRPLNGNDLSEMRETTIDLTKAEYSFMNARLGDRLVRKQRYRRDSGSLRFEISEFMDPLAPLIILDVELVGRPGSSEATTTADELRATLAKDFTIIREVTQITALAGGRLAGLTYDDVEPHLVST